MTNLSNMADMVVVFDEIPTMEVVSLLSKFLYDELLHRKVNDQFHVETEVYGILIRLDICAVRILTTTVSSNLQDFKSDLHG